MNGIGAEAVGMTIGQLAAAAGVGVETVRYYQRRGLMVVPPRRRGSIARYGPDALARLAFIRRAQALGFSLDDVAQLLSLDAGQDCAQARALASLKLAEVRQRLVALRVMEQALADLVERCGVGRGRVRCPLIDALGRSAAQPLSR